MQPGQPSHTAFRAAAHRAAHQTLESGRVFADPLAGAILGVTPAAVFGETLDSPNTRGMRLFIVARSRFAEDALASAVARGTRQYVVLGAGLDTFAHRNPFEDQGLRVFEVDHPATQAWKRERLREARLGPARSLVFAPVDFERETLTEGLARAGFDAGGPAFCSWLGVVVYLTQEAIFETLRGIAQGGAPREVVFDYGEPLESHAPEDRPALAARMARVADLGEPWISRFEPQRLAQALGEVGLPVIEDLGPAAIARRYLGRSGPERAGGHLMRCGRQG